MASVVTDQDRLEYARCVRRWCSHGPRDDYYRSGDLDSLACTHAKPVVMDKAQMVDLIHGRVFHEVRVAQEWKP